MTTLHDRLADLADEAPIGRVELQRALARLRAEPLATVSP
jgi:hypothetical protein